MKLCKICDRNYPGDYKICPYDQISLIDVGTEIVPGRTFLDKWDVVSKVGYGGMAIVYKLRHRTFGTYAAIKVLNEQYLQDPDFVTRFKNEAIMTHKLNHKNAVRFDDYDFTPDGIPYILMEFIEGISLEKFRQKRSGPLPIQMCLDIALQVTEALGAAHSHDIVHRDIKPSNIMVVREIAGKGTVEIKVVDFGIAKLVAGEITGIMPVKTEGVIGTASYISPDQILCKPVDGRSDIYSLGIVLYEILTGNHPFKPDRPENWIQEQLYAKPNAPNLVNPEISPAIAHLVLKALQKDPDRRFQTASELLGALRDPEKWYTEEQISDLLETSDEPIPNAPQPSIPIAHPAVPSLTEFFKQANNLKDSVNAEADKAKSAASLIPDKLRSSVGSYAYNRPPSDSGLQSPAVLQLPDPAPHDAAQNPLPPLQLGNPHPGEGVQSPALPQSLTQSTLNAPQPSASLPQHEHPKSESETEAPLILPPPVSPLPDEKPASAKIRPQLRWAAWFGSAAVGILMALYLAIALSGRGTRSAPVTRHPPPHLATSFLLINASPYATVVSINPKIGSPFALPPGDHVTPMRLDDIPEGSYTIVFMAPDGKLIQYADCIVSTSLNKHVCTVPVKPLSDTDIDAIIKGDSAK